MQRGAARRVSTLSTAAEHIQVTAAISKPLKGRTPFGPAQRVTARST